MTVERFHHENKTFGGSPSNAVVAIENDRPIAVVVGTERGTEVSISRIGVHPDFLRQGHGGNLLTTLRQKIAVSGREQRITVEVPDALDGACAFFQSAAYRRDATYTDWARTPIRVRPIPDALVAPMGVAELDERGLLDRVPDDVAWRRRRETLRHRGSTLDGAALVTDRVEAFVLFEPAPIRTPSLDVLAVHVRDAKHETLLGGALLRWLAGSYPKAVLRLLRATESECSTVMLERLGFAPVATHGRFTVAATSA